MGLFSMLGKVLLAWFLILSAVQTLHMFGKYERVREDYVAKMSGVMNFLEFCLGVTSTGKVGLISWFVITFNVLKMLGALLLLVNDTFGYMSGTYILMFYFLIATPVVYDFYLYKVGDPEFLVLLHGFMQNMALFGALLFLREMRLTIHQSQLKKKTPKSKSKSKSKSK